MQLSSLPSSSSLLPDRCCGASHCLRFINKEASGERDAEMSRLIVCLLLLGKTLSREKNIFRCYKTFKRRIKCLFITFGSDHLELFDSS